MNPGLDNTPVLATLGGEYKIFAKPLVLPAGSQGECYAAAALGHPGMELFALVGSATDCFRIDLAPRLQTLRISGLLSPMGCGVIDLPNDVQRYAMIFQQLPPVSVHQTIATQRRRFSETEILSQYLPPLVRCLKSLLEHEIFHGGINTGNLYLSNDGGLMLGECLSGTPSLLQPGWAQPVERAMTHPALRGIGTQADELFSIGACLASMALGQVPGGELKEEELTSLRLEKGSFSAMVGRATLSNNIGEVLRGLLEDDPEHRWSMEELERWLEGRHSTGHQSRTRQKPARCLEVDGVQCWDPPMVAQAFSRNLTEAMRLISNDDLIKWVRRTLRDMPLAERIADAVNMPSLKGKATSYEACLVSRVCIALHPAAPIRYMGLSLMPASIGTALQKTIALDESPQVLAEIVAAQLPKYWYNTQPEFSGAHMPALKSLEQARATLDRVQPGAGLERCLYELAPGSPLLAPEFGNRMILDMKSFTLQLEALAARADRPSLPFNRHSTAFFMAHDPVWTKPLNRFALASSELEKAMGCLQVLSMFQAKLGMVKLPNIARWLDPLVQPGILQLHNRDLQEKVRGELQNAVASGSLHQMYALLENPETHHRDHEGFGRAKREYAILAHNIAALQARVRPGASLHSRLAMEAATAVSGLVAGVAIAGVMLSKLGMLL